MRIIDKRAVTTPTGPIDMGIEIYPFIGPTVDPQWSAARIVIETHNTPITVVNDIASSRLSGATLLAMTESWSTAQNLIDAIEDGVCDADYIQMVESLVHDRIMKIASDG